MNMLNSLFKGSKFVLFAFVITLFLMIVFVDRQFFAVTPLR